MYFLNQGDTHLYLYLYLSIYLYIYIYMLYTYYRAFQVVLVVKNPPANARDTGSILGSGKSPGGRQSNPL